MKTLCIIIAIAALSVSMIGCSMCCGPYDYDYPAYGGTYQRTDPSYGRVGSPFSDPATATYGPSADSNLTESDPGRMREVPEDAFEDLEYIEGEREGMKKQLDAIDELERNKQNLPNPDKKTTLAPDSDETTASRIWRRRPLRPGEQWR